MSAFFSSFKDVVEQADLCAPQHNVLVTEEHTNDLLNEYRAVKQLVKSLCEYLDWSTATTGHREVVVYETMANVREAISVLDGIIMEYKIDSDIDDAARFEMNQRLAGSVHRIQEIVEESIKCFSIGLDELNAIAEALPSHYSLANGGVVDAQKTFESISTRSRSFMLLEMVTS